MKHQEYIEQQLNIIRFAEDKDYEIVKFIGVIEYFFFSKIIDKSQFDFYLSRAQSFRNYPDYLMNN